MTSGQIPFDLGHQSALSRDDFFVSDCNRIAVEWLDNWPRWPAPLLVIYGPCGCGKTHLCNMFAQKAGAAAVVIDDADVKMGDAKAEEEFFHLYNRFAETGQHILMTGALAPLHWKIQLPDLKSRILAAPAAAIGAPDDQMMAIVLSKLFSDRQVFVPQDVLQFILTRAERSFPALTRLADEIDKAALAAKRPVTIPLVRDVLQDKFL